MKKKKRLILLSLLTCLLLCLIPQTASAASKDAAARKAYYNYLSQKNIKWGDQYYPSSSYKFDVIDVNNDKVPELYIYNSSSYGYQGAAGLYRYHNGKVKEFYHFGNSQSLKQYYPSRSVFLDEGGRMGYYPCYYVKMNSNGTTKTSFYSLLQDSTINGQYAQITKYYSGSTFENSKEITKSDFKKRKAKLIGKASAKKPSLKDNTVANRKRYILPKPNNASTELNRTSLTLYMNTLKTYQFKAKIKGPDKKAIWSSSNRSVATVSSKGKVTAKKPGIAYITVKANGKSASCKVTVKRRDTMNKYLRIIQGAWYPTDPGQKYVIRGKDVDYYPGWLEGAHPRGREIYKIVETKYGAYFEVRYGSAAYYGMRYYKDKNILANYSPTGNPYAEEPYSPDDCLTRKRIK